MTYYNDADPYCCDWLSNLMDAGLITPGKIDDRSIADVSPDDLAGFRRVHFFAGLAGWEAALQIAGWPEDAEVWTGSAPCQPFSSAGKRKGTADERHLWPEFRRLIAACRPPIVFGEQVASADGRKWLGGVASPAGVESAQEAGHAQYAGVRAEMEALGYAVGAADLCASCSGEEGDGWIVHLGGVVVRERIVIGAPHIRQRLFWGAQRLADAGSDCESEAEGRQCGARGSGASGGVGDAECNASEQRRTSIESSEGAGAEVARSSTEPGRSGNASWSDFAIIPCLDGKSRRIESGSFPPAHGIPTRRADERLGCLLAELAKLGHSAKDARRILREARGNRTGRLKGYGNAIVPRLAAEFVGAFMGGVTTPEKGSGGQQRKEP